MHHWQDISTAPTGRPVWVQFTWNRARYLRIATHQAGERADPRQWDFDSKQVNLNIKNKLGQMKWGDHATIKITAWAELDNDHQEDPANLGSKRAAQAEPTHTPNQGEIPF